MVRGAARGSQAVGDVFKRIADVLYGLLPALLPPDDLARGLARYYRRVYSEDGVPWATEAEQALEAWEVEVLDRYRMAKGTMLVLGSGWGRESLALARRGIRVVGIDTNETSVRTARRRAEAAGVPARFHLASFLNLPYRSASWDYVLMAASMFSAVPGITDRRRLLTELLRLLKPGGLVVVSFLPQRQPLSGTYRLCTSVNKLLVRLPGTNRSYQPGDVCIAEHFLHAFQDEVEVAVELRDAGAVIREINWPRGFAVVAPPA